VKAAVAFACGLVFAAGLAVSGMVRPEKVLAFLELKDPALLFVMVPAVGLYALAAWRRRPAAPEKPVDARLVLGASIFGIGWGLAGICPGPAIVNLVRPSAFFLAFAAALLAGIAVGGIIRRRPAG
jgi:uncharacterized membrane protein YedE/YeeE